MQGTRLWKKVCDWFAPQAGLCDAEALPGLAERERLRRGRLLAALIAISLPLDILLLPSCLLPRPEPGDLLALFVGMVLEAGSAIPNRRGHVRAASIMFLLGIVLACAIGLFCVPVHALLVSCFVYIFYTLVIVDSGFLLGRRAPFGFAALSIGIITAHVCYNARHFLALPGFAGMPILTLAIIPGITMLALAVLACMGAGSMEDAIVRADQADRVEQMYRRAERQRQLAEHLQMLAARLAGELDGNALLRQIASEVCALDYAGCSIFLTETQPDGTRVLAAHLMTFDGVENLAAFRYAEDAPGVARVLAGESYRIRDLSRAEEYGEDARQLIGQQGIQEMLSVPIQYHGETLGCLTVFASETAWGQMLSEETLHSAEHKPSDRAPEHPDPFGPEAEAFLRALANHTALALGNAMLHRDREEAHARLNEKHTAVMAQTEELTALNEELLAMQNELEAQYRALEAANTRLAAQATTDGMTGLANHRAFQEELTRQAARAQRSRAPLALALLDVDYFKQYNDSFGHPAGDEVLKTVGRLLQSVVREGDFTARYGGEEFAVLLPDTDAETAQVVAERIRLAVESCAFAHRKVTVSIGIVQQLPAESAGAFLQRADVALYEAKSAGRNQVILMLPETSPAHSGTEACADISALCDDLFSRMDTLAEQGTLTTDEAVEVSEAGDFNTRADAEIISCAGFIPNVSMADGGLEGILQQSPAQVLAELIAALDRRGAETLGHAERVTRYALCLGHALADYYEEQRSSRPLLPRITGSDLVDFAFGALLHDIGKVGIPDSILLKTGKLTEDEWRQIRRHPLAGAEQITGFPLLSRALPVVRFHHEQWDGSGYPQGLAGEAIPLGARLFAVCDALDILTTDKPYRPRLDYAAAREEIARSAGTQFDPDVVAAFLRVSEAEWQRLSVTGVAAQKSWLPNRMRNAA